MKTYKLILDRKNQEVLIKKLYCQKMNRIEMKKLIRTVRIIEKSYNKVQINIQNEKKINDIFF